MITADLTQLKADLGGQLTRNRLSVLREARIQDAISVALADLGIEFEAEHILSGSSRIDFFLPEQGIGIEVKRGNAGLSVASQIGRYLDHSKVIGLLLVANRIHQKMPTELSGKPIAHLELWRHFL